MGGADEDEDVRGGILEIETENRNLNGIRIFAGVLDCNL